MPVLDEEEISDLVDVVLCADDVTLDTGMAERNLRFFGGGHKKSTKANVFRAFYGKLDTDYTTKTGDYLHITAMDDGLAFEIEGRGSPFHIGNWLTGSTA